MKSILDNLVMTYEDKMVDASTCSFDNRLAWVIE